MSNDGELESVVDGVINANLDQVKQYKAGKGAVLQYFVGQVMKETRGKADAEQVVELLKKKLN